MNTEYAVGKIHIHFESRTRRRWFVALLYAVLAAFGFAGFSAIANTVTVEWIVAGCGIVFTALWIIFSWIAGDERARIDERERHRRDHAHYLAYRLLFYFAAAAFLYCVVAGPSTGYFRGRFFTTPPLPSALIAAAFLFFVTLPQAILLWTEPDMDDPQRAG